MHSTLPLKLFLIDDQLIARQGLRVLLADSESVVIIGDAPGGESGIALCKMHQPDVILVEILLRNEDGLEVIRRLRETCPTAAILVMTYDISKALVQAALKAGVQGYLLKDASATEVLRAIQLLRVGQLALGTQVSQALVEATSQRSLALTDREFEVLLLLTQGLNNSAIASQLHISPYTVKNHVSNILSKLGAKTRTQAIVYALQTGLINTDIPTRYRITLTAQYGSA